MTTIGRWTVSIPPIVEDEILGLPKPLQVRLLKLIERMEHYGGNLGAPHTEPLGRSGLFELRAKAKDGIARSIYCYESQKQIVLLSAFVKKSRKTPQREIKKALDRLKLIQGVNNV